MNIVTLGYSVFHRYLEESGYYFISLAFFDIYNASYIYKTFIDFTYMTPQLTYLPLLFGRF